ncbi:uncharacterized protein I303_104541 [Kwoniella dejecticola CBS 10117]|uniref:Splicing factor 3B subunit 4 n=1 Tax=Kwoniella dejecticola CBS 10117 TaxID=1296121 RepID=A0A1A6A503_9TREE|nr:splicing factor 3B subunit 4 [Kwoniella dejecticola CBS 10117]OBR85149.1 splicing factor 3B subunit 4 [Kwoniella dejecticola CBS 10117]
MQNKAEQDRNQEATVYLGNLDEKCSDALIWELMLQAGPVSNVFLPKDRISMSHQGFGFCEFLTEADAEYAVKIMNQIKLYGKPIRVNKASYDKKQLDVGANLFVGSLDPLVDENTLADTFGTFGQLAEPPKIARDPTTGLSKGYAFIAYNDFEAADMAIENMNGQFFGGRQISVQYAFKKDGKGERHGGQAERLLAAQAKKHQLLPGSSTPAYQYQGQFAGALANAQTNAPPAQMPSYPPPPPQGIPVYQPQNQQPVYPGYPPQGPPQGYPPNGYPNGAGAGMPNGYAPPPPPTGFPIAGQMPQYGMPPQQAQGGAPPPPPPIRMGFSGQ